METLLFKSPGKISNPGPKPFSPKPKTKGLWAYTKISWARQDIQIQWRKDQMQVSNVDKNNVEQSSTVPNS